MIYGFNDSKEKVEFKDAIIVRDIETTISQITEHSSVVKVVPLSSYQITGYQLIGLVGQFGGNGIILNEWTIISPEQGLTLEFFNVSNSGKADVTIKVKGLYIRVS